MRMGCRMLMGMVLMERGIVSRRMGGGEELRRERLMGDGSATTCAVTLRRDGERRSGGRTSGAGTAEGRNRGSQRRGWEEEE